MCPLAIGRAHQTGYLVIDRPLTGGNGDAAQQPEAAALDRSFWRGKRVLLTGHTGFKGSWLALWLHALESKVTGYALPQPDDRALYHQARVGETLMSITGDVRDAEHLHRVVDACRPEVIIHMAAQPLVRYSYRHPLETYATNVMGTAHVLDAARRIGGVRAIVCVTSDKCYENRETPVPYTEADPMGGADPYSSSKGAAELVVAAYRRSFFEAGSVASPAVGILTARAGNVIGGGDWAEDRLVVDVVSSFMRGETPVLRHPAAVRPWQFVLEPLAGYLLLAQHAAAAPASYAGGWNFGPDEADCRTVRWVVDLIAERWGTSQGWALDDQPAVHEAQLLLLNTAKARTELGWRPRLALADAIAWTVDWYRAFHRGTDVEAMTVAQIARYEALP